MQRRQFISRASLAASGLVLAATAPAAADRTTQGFTVKAGASRNGRQYKMKGVTYNVLDVKISADDTDGRLTVFEQTGFTPKGGPPLHLHHFQDELFYVLEGEYLFQVGKEQFRLQPGDTIFLPRQVPHAFAQLTEKGRMLLSFQPSGKMESFFRETAALTAPPTEQQVVQLFEAHEMQVVGPPLRVE